MLSYYGAESECGSSERRLSLSCFASTPDRTVSRTTLREHCVARRSCYYCSLLIHTSTAGCPRSLLFPMARLPSSLLSSDWLASRLLRCSNTGAPSEPT